MALLALASPALAQTHPAWVAVYVFADIDRTWTEHVPVGFGGSVAAGVSITRGMGFEAALDWPKAETVRSTPYKVTTSSIAGIGALSFRVRSGTGFQVDGLAGLSLVS